MLVASPAAAAPPPDPLPLPSKEQIEFLVEWQDVDEDTFQLLLENGIRDAAERPAKEEKRHD